MSEGDNVNLLSHTATNKKKVCFCYDYGASKLNISVRYTKLTVIGNFHSTYLTNVPQGELMQPNSNINNAPRALDNDEDQVDIIDLQLMIGSRI